MVQKKLVNQTHHWEKNHSWQLLYKLVLPALFIVGAGSRIVGSLRGYFAFTFDQGRDLLVLADVFNHFKLPLIGPSSGVEGVFHGAWWYWSLVPLYFMAQGDPLWLVTLFGIISSGTILLAYIFGKGLQNKQLGLIFASLVATSPFFIGTSAQLWNPNVVPLLMIVFLIVLWLHIFRQLSFFWVGLVMGVLFEFHIGFGFMLLIAVGVCILSRQLKLNLREGFVAIIGFGFWLLPRLVFELRHNFLQTKSFIMYVTNPATKHTSLPLIARLSDRIMTLFNQFNDAFARGNIYLSILLLGMMVISSYILIRKRDKQSTFIVLLLTLMSVLYLSASLYPDAMWSYYFIGFPSLFLPFVALTIYELRKKAGKIGWVIFTMYCIYLLAPWKYFDTSWPGDASVYKNQLAAVQAIYKRASDEPFNVSVFSPSVIDYNYQYIFSWYGNKTYGYIPNRENILPKVFFIIEPDPWNKGLREIWIQEREGDGKTIWKTTLPGEIEIQERSRS